MRSANFRCGARKLAAIKVSYHSLHHTFTVFSYDTTKLAVYAKLYHSEMHITHSTQSSFYSPYRWQISGPGKVNHAKRWQEPLLVYWTLLLRVLRMCVSDWLLGGTLGCFLFSQNFLSTRLKCKWNAWFLCGKLQYFWLNGKCPWGKRIF